MHERLSTALGIVRALADRTRPLEPLTVGALSAMTGTSTSTASRICAELDGVGLIAHAEGYGAYRIGNRAVALSGSAAAPFAIACDFALTLAYQATGETVALVAASPRGPIVIAVIESGRTLHVAMTVGGVLTDPDGAVLRALGHPPPAGSSAVTFGSRNGRTAEVATPVLGPQGECLAALVVRYPQHRSEQVTPVAERAVLAARRQLERSVAQAAAVPPPPPAPLVHPADTTVQAAADLLSAISGAGTTSIAELVRVTGLRPDRVRRLLEVCQRVGLASPAQDGEAAALPWSVHGWHRGIVDATLRGPAQQLLTAAAVRAGNTAYLTVRLGMRSSTVAEAIVDGALAMGSWLGRPAQLIGSDGGPVLVQHFDDAQIRQVFPSHITRTASGTPKDLAAFLKQVQRARAHQPLVLPDFGEDGLTSVAAPVRDAGGAVVAAACIVGPGPEMAAGMPAIQRLTCELAESVSQLLGAPGPAGSGSSGGDGQRKP